MEQDQDTSLFQLNIDGQSSYTLKNAASWAKVLAIVGFIMAILFVIFGVMMQTLMEKATSGSRYYGEEIGTGGMKMAGTMGLIIYVILGALYAISSLFSLNCANKISSALKTNDQAMLNAGFSGARNYFAFWAIMMIICLLFMLIGVAGMAFAPK